MSNFNSYFLNNTNEGINVFKESINDAIKILIENSKKNSKPFSGINPEKLDQYLKSIPLHTEDGECLSKTLEDISNNIVKHSLNVTHPLSVAHLHCPPLIPSIVAELIISAMNQSMDSWDQSPSATHLEKEMINWLNIKIGWGNKSDGVFTSGGTQSNYMGLLLARNHFCSKQWDWCVRKKGLPSDARKMRIICSEEAHFSVIQAAHQLGLGEESVITIENNQCSLDYCKNLNFLILELRRQGLHPFAIVGTFGTTDLGTLEPIKSLEKIAKSYDIWLHIDAAYGGALLLSSVRQKEAQVLKYADSLTIDFHKLFYQTISCGAFLLRDGKHYDYMKLHADYLNPVESNNYNMIHLVEKSIQTTRRFDALKLLVTLRVVGTKKLGEMIDYTLDLAVKVASNLNKQADFEVLNEKPQLNAVVFRYKPSVPIFDISLLDEINREIQQDLLINGDAVIARTKIKGKVYLKLTILNPRTTERDILHILEKVRLLGNKLLLLKVEREDESYVKEGS